MTLALSASFHSAAEADRDSPERAANAVVPETPADVRKVRLFISGKYNHSTVRSGHCKRSRYAQIPAIAFGLCLTVLAAIDASHLLAAGQAADAPTYYRDVLPILQKNCQSCHRPGQIAPFSMLSYESTRPWARSIKTKVESRQMPPWFADPHVQEFSNNPSLSDGQVSTIVKWVEGGG